jgi:GTPase
MATLPTVAIIGRPNTGKSTLFNRLIGQRKAIVSDIPGTTRDHVAHRVDHEELPYLLVDTGGIGGGTEDKELESDVLRQSLLALENADLIVLTINSKEDLTADDFEIVSQLRKRKRQHVPVLIALTKCDNVEAIDSLLPQYYELGMTEDIIPVSAVHRYGVDDLEDEIVTKLQELHFQKQSPTDHAVPRIAIIGKPNVGKSSIVNAFMSETQRQKSPLLVSDIPGTTRDSTDTIIRFNDQDYLFIDTAGIKRRSQTEKDIETFAYFRSTQALGECDICVLVLDATEPVSKQDKRIAGMAVEEGKGLIILLNKTDLLPKDELAERQKQLKMEFQFCRFAPVIPCSAATREGLLKLFDSIEMVQRNRTRRIPTNDLLRWYQQAAADQPMASLARSKFITQADELPPTFVLFVPDPKQVHVSQLRYLENQLRQTFAFDGTTVRWVTKQG